MTSTEVLKGTYGFDGRTNRSVLNSYEEITGPCGIVWVWLCDDICGWWATKHSWEQMLAHPLADATDNYAEWCALSEEPQDERWIACLEECLEDPRSTDELVAKFQRQYC